MISLLACPCVQTTHAPPEIIYNNVRARILLTNNSSVSHTSFLLTQILNRHQYCKSLGIEDCCVLIQENGSNLFGIYLVTQMIKVTLYYIYDQVASQFSISYTMRSIYQCFCQLQVVFCLNKSNIIIVYFFVSFCNCLPFLMTSNDLFKRRTQVYH